MIHDCTIGCPIGERAGIVSSSASGSVLGPPVAVSLLIKDWFRGQRGILRQDLNNKITLGLSLVARSSIEEVYPNRLSIMHSLDATYNPSDRRSELEQSCNNHYTLRLSGSPL